MAQRKERGDKTPDRTEERFQEDAPPSELGDVEDAVAPEVGGELTSWAPPGQDDEEE